MVIRDGGHPGLFDGWGDTLAVPAIVPLQPGEGIVSDPDQLGVDALAQLIGRQRPRDPGPDEFEHMLRLDTRFGIWGRTGPKPDAS